MSCTQQAAQGEAALAGDGELIQGIVQIDPDGSAGEVPPLNVLCQREEGRWWTLLRSWSLGNNDQFRDKPFQLDAEMGTPNSLDAYSLSNATMLALRAQPQMTHGRATCNLNGTGGTDYLLFALEELDPLTFSGAGVLKRMERVSIRGYTHENDDIHSGTQTLLGSCSEHATLRQCAFRDAINYQVLRIYRQTSTTVSRMASVEYLTEDANFRFDSLMGPSNPAFSWSRPPPPPTTEWWFGECAPGYECAGPGAANPPPARPAPCAAGTKCPGPHPAVRLNGTEARTRGATRWTTSRRRRSPSSCGCAAR